MIIAGKYSFNNGLTLLQKQHAALLDQIEHIIAQVSASLYQNKKSREKTIRGRLLYSPVRLNKAFKEKFVKRGWKSKRVSCDYPTKFYLSRYNFKPLSSGAFREIDFLKDRVGVEVQFGKYAFMVYNVCAKMTIFHNLGFIDTGVEIVPLKNFADKMSTGVSYFEQIVWDLEKRGISNIDIPVLVIGIDK